MNFKNLDKAAEIKTALEFLNRFRAKLIEELSEQNKRIADNAVMKQVNSDLRLGIVDLENKIIDKLKEEIKGL